MYTIEYEIDFEKTCRNIPIKDLKRIKEKIESLKENPRPNGAIKLANREFYRIRIGKYRVVYGIFDHKLVVLVVNVDHRKDIYE